MKLKERINNSLDTMNLNQLISIYEHIRLLQHTRIESPSRTKTKTIKAILDLTKSSKSNWSDSITEEREDRI
jgi:hypothetical protein